MLDGLVALHLGHGKTKAQFEMDVGAGAGVRRAEREHRSRFRVGAAVAVHSLARRSGARETRSSRSTSVSARSTHDCP